MKPFQQRGGAVGLTRNGFVLYVSWPFASLSVSDDAVRLSISGRGRNYPKASLLRVEVVRSLIMGGVRFSTSDPGRSFTFKSLQQRKLLAALAERGYELRHADA